MHFLILLKRENEINCYKKAYTLYKYFFEEKLFNNKYIISCCNNIFAYCWQYPIRLLFKNRNGKGKLVPIHPKK